MPLEGVCLSVCLGRPKLLAEPGCRTPEPSPAAGSVWASFGTSDGAGGETLEVLV